MPSPGKLSSCNLTVYSMPIKASVIDLFAGPGGLGEGFSALTFKRNRKRFEIELSVEMEPSAHKTLELRAFFRQFSECAPKQYYEYLRGEISRGDLFSAFPRQSHAAARETLGEPTALGDASGDRRIYRRLKELRRNDRPRVVIGGPPCQAYSLVGRARNKGVSGYKAESDHRHFLYQEYLQVLWTMRPEVFVMENVKGILSSKVNGQRVFPRILEDLSHPGRALGKKGGEGLHDTRTRNTGIDGRPIRKQRSGFCSQERALWNPAGASPCYSAWGSK